MNLVLGSIQQTTSSLADSYCQKLREKNYARSHSPGLKLS